ncbi:MAG TPA: hypothetical protein VFQ25_17100 [Ktedonobacterales bacterium]|nr:hypothetical protein [Ktedonobacterales bacterium]
MARNDDERAPDGATNAPERAVERMDGAVMDRLEELVALRRLREALGLGDGEPQVPEEAPDGRWERRRPRMGNDTPLRPAH